MKYRKRKRNGNGYLSQVVGTGVTNMVGIGMIGATAEMANALPAGTAKTITGVVPGLQSTALLGANVGMLKGKKKKGFW